MMFEPPYDWAAVLARQSQGGMALLAVVDSRKVQAWHEATKAVFPALIHLGMPYAIHDRAAGPLGIELIRSHPAVLLAQEGLSQGLTLPEQEALLEGLSAGTGLVNLDPGLPLQATALAGGLGLSAGAPATTCSAIRTLSNDHYLTHTRVPGEQIGLLKPVPLLAAAAGSAPMPLASESGAPVLVAGCRGGRYVHFCLSPRVWLNDHLGHGNGLDGTFWRSVVWAARKPFLMKAMPPFVTIRIDDAQGVGGLWWNLQQCLVRRPLHIPEPIQDLLCDFSPGRRSVAHSFGYIDVFNKHGIIPAIGLFIDQVSAEDRAILKRYHDAGKAEFSIHAFSEYTRYRIGDGEEARVTEFLYHKGWHEAADGAFVIDEYTPEELAHNFARADRFWAETGMRPSRVVNTHYVNPGVNSLPFLKARGQDLMMFAALFGRMYDSHYLDPWSRAPYGSMGMVFDYLPVPAGVPDVAAGDFFNAEAHYYDPYQLADTGHVDDGNIDFTVGATMKGCVRDDNDLQAAAENILRQVRVGLDGLFFGCMMAHEQGLAVLTAPELDEILTLTDRALSRHDMLFASYEHIAEYARCKVDSHIAAADECEGAISCRLTGQTTLPLQLYLFHDDGDGCRYEFRQVPPFSGGLCARI